MCLISILPKGKPKYTKQVYDFIKKGITTNDDGSGFMFKRHDEQLVTVKKGFFTYEHLISSLEACNLTDEDELVIHHRNGTSGLISAENCHPFVISKLNSELANDDITTNKAALVHNGVFYGINDYMKLNPDFSDTFAFVKYIMAEEGMLKMYLYNNDLFSRLTSTIVGTDKLCIIDPDLGIVKSGNYIEEDGYFHSNSGYCTSYYDRGGVGFGSNFTKAKNGVSGTNKSFLVNNTRFKAVKLDERHVSIGPDNFDDFYYVDKDDYNNRSIETYVIKTWDINSDWQLLYRSTNHSIAIVKPESRINSSYYYIPKTAQLQTVYSNYLELINIKFALTSKSSKKYLDKCINKSSNKGPFDFIKFNKLSNSKFILKKTLDLYVKKLEKKDVATQPELELVS